MSDSILQVNQIKDKGGNATGITVADSSANVTINNLVGGNIGTAVTGFGLIRNAQEFRIAGVFAGSGSAGTILGSGGGNDSWEENDTDYSRHGTSVWSQSSGTFSCSATGIYLCTWSINYRQTGTPSNDQIDPGIKISTDSGSSYNIRAKMWINLADTPVNLGAGNTFMFDVTNTTTFRLQYCQSLTNNAVSGTDIQGSSTTSLTNIVFVRLGDT